MNFDVKFWLTCDEGKIFGPGKVALLLATDSLGSLHKAAKSFGMSYRTAWGRIRKTEELLGIRLLDNSDPDRHGQAHGLTFECREILSWYQKVTDNLKTVAEKELSDLPSCLVKISKDKN